jgi:hypothetical protein
VFEDFKLASSSDCCARLVAVHTVILDSAVIRATCTSRIFRYSLGYAKLLNTIRYYYQCLQHCCQQMGDGGAPSEGWMPLLIARPGDHDAHESDESDEEDSDYDGSSSSSSRRRRRGRSGRMQRLLRVVDVDTMQEVPPPTAPAGEQAVLWCLFGIH